MSWIIAIFALGILIFIHELGHFVGGLLVGIKAEVFSIGYGRGIVYKHIKGVKFQIGWIPLGGYCKFKGESSDDSGEESEDAFFGMHPLKRIVVVFFGPLFNLIFAIIIFAIISLMPSEIRVYDTNIEVYDNYKYIDGGDEITPAYKYGLRTGDKITSLNDITIESSVDYNEALRQVIQDNQDINITFERLVSDNRAQDGKVMELVETSTVIPISDYYKSFDRSLSSGIGFHWAKDLTISEIVDDSSADKAGFKTGDKIVGFYSNDSTLSAIYSFVEFKEIVFNNPSTSIAFAVNRDNDLIKVNIIPDQEESGDLVYGYAGIGFIDNAIRVDKVPGSPIYKALPDGVYGSANVIVQYVLGIKKLIFKEIEVDNAIGGPIRVLDITQEISRFGFFSLASFVAQISIILFLMNLLPIPMVDGSVILYSIIEIIRRKPINRALLARIQTVGAVILISLIVFITLNDIMQMFRS